MTYPSFSSCTPRQPNVCKYAMFCLQEPKNATNSAVPKFRYLGRDLNPTANNYEAGTVATLSCISLNQYSLDALFKCHNASTVNVTSAN